MVCRVRPAGQPVGARLRKCRQPFRYRIVVAVAMEGASDEVDEEALSHADLVEDGSFVGLLCSMPLLADDLAPPRAKSK